YFGFIRIDGIFYGIAADRLDAKHIRLKSRDVRRFLPHFILDRHTHHVKYMQREEHDREVSQTGSAQRAHKTSLKGRLEDISRTGSMEISLKQRFANDVPLGFRIDKSKMMSGNDRTYFNERALTQRFDCIGKLRSRGFETVVNHH